MNCKYCKQEMRLGPGKHQCAEGDAATKEKADDRSNAAACSHPSVVYVVATGKMRVAIESEIPLTPDQVSVAAIERFVKMGCPPLGEITECSDHADASDPHYAETRRMLEKAGCVHIAPFSDDKEEARR